MSGIYEQAAAECVRFLTESTPEDWANLPKQTVTPEEFAGLVALQLESDGRGYSLDFGQQTYISARLDLAVKALTVRAREFEIWAWENGREDLVRGNADLAVDGGAA